MEETTFLSAFWEKQKQNQKQKQKQLLSSKKQISQNPSMEGSWISTIDWEVIDNLYFLELSD